jgi:putative oxidoreductase
MFPAFRRSGFAQVGAHAANAVSEFRASRKQGYGAEWLPEFHSPSPAGGIAGQFIGVLYVSYYVWVIFAFQVIAGVLLLVNRYVPLSVAVLAPVIVNILSFHALMAPSGLPLALLVAVLWAVIFVDVKPAFAALFQSRLDRSSKRSRDLTNVPVRSN